MGAVRIIHVVYGLKLAGAERLIADLAAGLDRRRYDSSVAVLSMGGPIEAELAAAGVPVRSMRKRGRYDAAVLLRLARLFRRERPDVVHTHLFGGDVWGRAAAAMARVPLIVSTLHGMEDRLSPLQRALERWTARFAGRLLAVSAEVKRFYAEEIGIPAGRIEVVYNGVDCRVAVTAADREAARRELGAAAGVPLVVTACRLEREKDIGTWLRAARLIADASPAARFLVAGEGAMRRGLEEEARSLGLAGAVRFLGLRGDARRILAAADLVMFSSVSEGVSLALLEAMAAGRAVVTTRVGGNREVVRDGVDGLLVPPTDPAALAGAVLRLLGNPGERERLGRAAAETVERRFNRERWLAEMAAVYEEAPAAAASREGMKNKAAADHRGSSRI
ncbi:MAG: glycosyltransferase [bacterium]|nr:glycosyltransferase [bacterium]